MSAHGDLLDAVTTAVNNLELSMGGVAVRARRQKLPSAQESLDTVPLVAVTPDPVSGRDVPFDSEENRLREFRVNVVLISKGNADVRAQLGDGLTWREAVQSRFGIPVPVNVEGLLQTRVLPDAPLDRRGYSKNYDYSAVGLSFDVITNVPRFPISDDGLMTEDGGFLLLEDGGFLLLE